jgi:flagellar biosynthetic protein FliR
MNELPSLARLAVLLVRPGVVVMLAPTIGGAFVPSKIKMGLTVLIAIGLLPSVPVPEALPLGALVTVIAREVAIGLAIGLTIRALVTAIEFAGHLSGFQMGLSYAATIDPANGVRNNTIASLFGMLAVLTLFGIDGHHTILRGLAHSYTGLPIGVGDGVDGGSLLNGVRQTMALVFVTGARLAAPIVVVLIVVEVVIGFISRAAPALSFMVIGYPIRMILGLFVLGLVVSTVPGVVTGLTDRTVRLALETAGAFK